MLCDTHLISLEQYAKMSQKTLLRPI